MDLTRLSRYFLKRPIYILETDVTLKIRMKFSEFLMKVKELLNVSNTDGRLYQYKGDDWIERCIRQWVGNRPIRDYLSVKYANYICWEKFLTIV